MNRKKDPMGRAIADYWKTKTADRLRVFSPMFEEDEIPLTTLFRSYEDMPEIEQKALDMAKGRDADETNQWQVLPDKDFYKSA
jgi:hypothetical protein